MPRSVCFDVSKDNTTERIEVAHHLPEEEAAEGEMVNFK
jgi:hypothetical protein